MCIRQNIGMPTCRLTVFCLSSCYGKGQSLDWVVVFRETMMEWELYLRWKMEVEKRCLQQG